MTNILGISIGTRNVGIAVIRQRKLTDYRIRTFPGKWSPEKCDIITEIMQKVIERNDITQIVLKIPVPSHCSENIRLLTGDIEERAKRQRIDIFTCTIADIKSRYTSAKRSNKREVIEALVAKYPELLRRSKKGSQTILYHAKLFEAIACAEMAQGAGHS